MWYSVSALVRISTRFGSQYAMLITSSYRMCASRIRLDMMFAKMLFALTSMLFQKISIARLVKELLYTRCERGWSLGNSSKSSSSSKNTVLLGSHFRSEGRSLPAGM